jgi:hypothetical protein
MAKIIVQYSNYTVYPGNRLFMLLVLLPLPLTQIPASALPADCEQILHALQAVRVLPVRSLPALQMGIPDVLDFCTLFSLPFISPYINPQGFNISQYKKHVYQNY